MIPTSYRAVELREYTDGLPAFHVVQKERTELEKGEVLVKIAASPINPSDLAFLKGQYGIKKKLPCIPGFEASGTVVASGGGFYANYLKGKNVACSASPTGDGTWAEYMKVPAQLCLPLKKSNRSLLKNLWKNQLLLKKKSLLLKLKSLNKKK